MKHLTSRKANANHHLPFGQGQTLYAEHLARDPLP
jgi:hypothetical protein